MTLTCPGVNVVFCSWSCRPSGSVVFNEELVGDSSLLRLRWLEVLELLSCVSNTSVRQHTCTCRACLNVAAFYLNYYHAFFYIVMGIIPVTGSGRPWIVLLMATMSWSLARWRRQVNLVAYKAMMSLLSLLFNSSSSTCKQQNSMLFLYIKEQFFIHYVKIKHNKTSLPEDYKGPWEVYYS